MAQKIKAPGQFMWSHFKHEANTTVWFQNWNIEQLRHYKDLILETLFPLFPRIGRK